MSVKRLIVERRTIVQKVSETRVMYMCIDVLSSVVKIVKS